MNRPPSFFRPRRLETGLRMGLRFGGDAQSKAASNLFEDNRQNLVLALPFGDNLPATPVFWPQCNTFRRNAPSTFFDVDAALPPVTVGMLVENGMSVVLDKWERRTTPVPGYPGGQPNWEYMKNRFVQAGGNATTPVLLKYLQNDNAGLIRYNAYETKEGLVNYAVNLRAEIALPARQSGMMVMNAAGGSTAYSLDQACRVADGINDGFNPRPAPPTTPTPSTPVAKAWVGPNSPNPVTDETVVPVHLLEPTTTAVLLVRDVLDGHIVLTVPVPATATEIRFSVANLRSGVYIYSMLADGIPVEGTRRLLVNH